MPEVRIIVGGPPNSGKSTLVISLTRALWQIGIKAERVELDAWAPTLDYIDGKITKGQRDSLKQRAVTKEDAQRDASKLREASKDGSIAIGDCPGKISEELKIIVASATHAVILCRSDKVRETESWREVFSEVGIPVVAELTSRLTGTEAVQESADGIIRGTFVGLDRTPKKSPAMSQLAFLLKSKLGI